MKNEKTRVSLLMYEDTDGNKNVNSAYATYEIAQAWMGALVAELLIDAGLANEDDEEKITKVRELLEAGKISEATSAFNDLRGDQVWIEEAEVGVEIPSPGQTVGYIQ